MLAVERPSVLVLAAAAYMANRAFCVGLGDHTQMPWEQAHDWQRRSAIESVEAALDGSTFEQVHEKWCDGKRRDGWTYGRLKNADQKQHPCLIPYGDLPEKQKQKDKIFCETVRSLSAVS